MDDALQLAEVFIPLSIGIVVVVSAAAALALLKRARQPIASKLEIVQSSASPIVRPTEALPITSAVTVASIEMERKVA